MAFSFLIWLICLIFLGYILRKAVEKTFFGKIYYLIIFPGVVLHELSHALGCLLTGAKIYKIKFFSKSGGQVLHSRSKIPILGSFLISLAPIFGATFVLYLLARIFTPNLLSFTSNNFGTFKVILLNLIVLFWQNLKSLNFGNANTYFFLYFVLTFSFAMAPSKSDLKNTFWSIVALSLILALLSPFFSLNFLKSISLNLGSFYLFGIGMELLAITVVGLIFIFRKLVKTI